MPLYLIAGSSVYSKLDRSHIVRGEECEVGGGNSATSENSEETSELGNRQKRLRITSQVRDARGVEIDNALSM